MNSPNSRLNLLLLGTGVAALAIFGAASANAQARPTDPSTLDILSVLVEKGVLSRADADTVLAEARKRSEANSDVVRVPYVPEAVRNQIREEVKKDVVETAKREGWAAPGSMPGWLERFTFGGDLRVRGEYQNYAKSNVLGIDDINAINADGGYFVDDVRPLLPTTEDRFRTRVRARFSVDAKINEHFEAGVRFVTGNLNDPVSTNETMTNNFGKLNVGLDRAYLRARPFGKDSSLADTNVIFGKFDNPFFSTEILFDRDLQFDGVAGTLSHRFGTEDGAPRVFLTAGAFPLEEWNFTGNDKYLFAGQIGASVSPVAGVRLKAAAALYDFSHVQGLFNTPNLRDNDYTAPSRVQFGNSMFNLRRDGGVVNTVLFGLSSKFRVGAATLRAEFDVNPTLVATIDAEALKNFDYDVQDLVDRGGIASSGDMAWHVRLGIGHPNLGERGAWNLNAAYRHIEADATLDLFTDSDFGLGGTDQKGFVVQGSYGLAKNVWLTGSWYSARTMDRTGVVLPDADLDTFMFDINAKF